MSATRHPRHAVNALLDSLPRRNRLRLVDLCDTVELEFGAVLCDEGRAYTYAYFPLTGFISIVATVSGHPALEMGLIGSEGMLGVTLVLGVELVPLRCVVQGPGTALRISAARLRRELRANPAVVQALNRYQYVLMAQLSQSAACGVFHEVGARLARWLLMTDDRANGASFHLTHQFLADMLEVQRSAVTIAAGVLQKRRLIRYTRGNIEVLNRPGLEAAACECYARTVAHYEALLP